MISEHDADIKEVLDSRYDDLKSGRVQPISGEDVEKFFENLKRREDELLQK